ncbi:MAG: hypothetical protein HYS25_07575 [Ignavibacteriales bacterium]|nr:hypothetical protein [Ignavibacteriales bacterium]
MKNVNKTYRVFARLLFLLILTGNITNAGSTAKSDKIVPGCVTISQTDFRSNEVLSDYNTLQFQANPEIYYNISLIFTTEQSIALLPNRYRTNKGFLSYPKN